MGTYSKCMCLYACVCVCMCVCVYVCMYVYTRVHSLTLSLEIPMSPLSLVSVFVQERNSIPNSSREDQSFTNQHLASWLERPSSDVCSTIIFLAMVFILHFGGAIIFLRETRKSGEYLKKVYFMVNFFAEPRSQVL